VSGHDAQLLHDYLLAAARQAPDKLALVCPDQRLTYAEIDGRSNQLAWALRRRGVERGDRVVVFAENGPEAVIAFWAALKADAVVSVVNPLTRPDKLAYLLADCRARALVTEAHLARVFEPAASRSPHLASVVVAGRVEEGRLLALPGGVSWAEVLGPERPDVPPPRAAIDVDLAALVYTSGSTGEPKGVMLTHRNMLAASRSITEYLEIRADDVILNVLPLAFDYGLYQMIMAFRQRARLVLERSAAYPARMLEVMAGEAVTGFPGVPTIFAVLAGMTDLSRYNLSRVRYVTNTAAALPARHIRALQRIFPRARLFSMYGLTECKRCTYLPPEMIDVKPGSVGIAIPNTELWLVDEHDRRLGPGEVGQLVIRGATVMAGYWEKPEATARRLRPGPVPGERVLYTGDLCRLDEDGYLYFVARMDDVIKSRGEKVAPREVEDAIADVPGVREVAVIGVPDDILGQAVKAFVVLDPGATLTEEDLRRECLKRLEPFLVPKYIEMRAELPKTGTGKVAKTALF
jgi:amino acid adenylation domain-containing protein